MFRKKIIVGIISCLFNYALDTLKKYVGLEVLMAIWVVIEDCCNVWILLLQPRRRKSYNTTVHGLHDYYISMNIKENILHINIVSVRVRACVYVHWFKQLPTLCHLLARSSLGSVNTLQWSTCPSLIFWVRLSPVCQHVNPFVSVF
jgi:hypothetical protein